MSSVVCICIFAKLFIEMYMYICFEGLREDWLSQLSYPHKIKKLLTYLFTISKATGNSNRYIKLVDAFMTPKTQGTDGVYGLFFFFFFFNFFFFFFFQMFQRNKMKMSLFS